MGSIGVVGGDLGGGAGWCRVHALLTIAMLFLQAEGEDDLEKG